MSGSVIDRGYVVGPTLRPGEQPFAERWEQLPDLDSHAHVWETVLVVRHDKVRVGPVGQSEAEVLRSEPIGHAVHLDEVVRCQRCHCPRCGHSTDADPCLLRHHHRVDSRLPYEGHLPSERGSTVTRRARGQLAGGSKIPRKCSLSRASSRAC